MNQCIDDERKERDVRWSMNVEGVVKGVEVDVEDRKNVFVCLVVFLCYLFSLIGSFSFVLYLS